MILQLVPSPVSLLSVSSLYLGMANLKGRFCLNQHFTGLYLTPPDDTLHKRVLPLDFRGPHAISLYVAKAAI
ncbi:hypothetical protein BJX76DRAFT_324459 [Aspergillus varians]